MFSDSTPASPVRLEVCVDSAAGALVAKRAGASRIELCAGLIEGGTTPSAGAIAAAITALRDADSDARPSSAAFDVRVLIRPRAGDFVYDDSEFDTMRRDIDHAAESGVSGIVFGILTPEGSIDVPRMTELIKRARPLEITFHRALDMTPDPHAALETLVDLGIERVLTAGAKSSVADGLETLRRLVERADSRIIVMPGGGVRDTNIREVVTATGAREIHLSARASRDSVMRFRNPDCRMATAPPPGEYERRVTDEATLRRCLDAVRV